MLNYLKQVKQTEPTQYLQFPLGTKVDKQILESNGESVDEGLIDAQKPFI